MALTGEAKKTYQRKYMRGYMKARRNVKTLPEWRLHPNRYLLAHLKHYPNLLTEMDNGTYDPELDPYINPLLRPTVVKPNQCEDFKIWTKTS